MLRWQTQVPSFVGLTEDSTNAIHGNSGFRTKLPSVAPDDITGTTTTSAQKLPATPSIAPKISVVSGDGGDTVAGFTCANSTKVSATAVREARTTTDVSVPRISLQFTVACAVCGSALSACPPERRVATQAISCPAPRGMFDCVVEHVSRSYWTGARCCSNHPVSVVIFAAAWLGWRRIPCGSPGTRTSTVSTPRILSAL